jgi:hypothetical protein
MAKPAGTGGALSVKPRRPHRRPLAFFSLVFILSIPFWIIGQASPVELLPALPVGAFMLVTPVVASSILVHQAGGAAGVRALLQRAFDFRRIPPLWYIPAILLMPCLTVVSYGLMRLMRAPLPHPEIPLLLGLALWPALVAGAMAEELGWSGYAIDPLQEHWGGAPGGHCRGNRLGRVAPCPTPPGAPSGGMDRLVGSGHRRFQSGDRLALQQHWEERFCGQSLPRNAQSLLATVP